MIYVNDCSCIIAKGDFYRRKSTPCQKTFAIHRLKSLGRLQIFPLSSIEKLFRDNQIIKRKTIFPIFAA